MIWKRYFFKELFLTFSFVLIASYFLYMVIDYSTNAKLFQQKHLYPWDLLLYYFYQFSKHAEILIPIALLLATLKVILTANVQRELLILLAAGISLKKITRPFFLFGLSIMILCYLNFEYLQPNIYLKLIKFQQLHLNKHSASETGCIHPITLEDQSLLVYHIYDPIDNKLEDLLWQKNKNEIYKIDTLYFHSYPPKGLHVDYLHYEEGTNKLTLVTHHESMDFPTMILPDHFSVILRPPKWHSLSALAQMFPLKHPFKLNDKQSSAATLFLYKLFMPLISLIVVAAPLAFCTRFSRMFSVFFIYGFFLFGYITCFTLLNASVILGENQILHPLVAICLPISGLLLLFGYKYAKL